MIDLNQDAEAFEKAMAQADREEADLHAAINQVRSVLAARVNTDDMRPAEYTEMARLCKQLLDIIGRSMDISEWITEDTKFDASALGKLLMVNLDNADSLARELSLWGSPRHSQRPGADRPITVV